MGCGKLPLQVSWIRNRDSHILTVDRYTFISDERFTAWHEAPTQTWTLQVRYVQERDAGRYECQVSTEPKMSHFVQLNVISEYNPRPYFAFGLGNIKKEKQKQRNKIYERNENLCNIYHVKCHPCP